MSNPNPVIKDNLAFIYGRNAEVEKYDPDKRVFVPTSRQELSEVTISSFSGEYAALSPSYPCDVYLSGDFSIAYPSLEHALQASKCTNQNIRAEIAKLKDIRDAKRLAVKSGDISAEVWRERSASILDQLLRDKFFRHKEALSALQRSGCSRLKYENNFNDTHLGVCGGKGRNVLGVAMERLRDGDPSEFEPRWMSDHFRCCEAGTVAISVTCYKDGALDPAASQLIERRTKVVVGRSEDAHVLAEHPSISRKHAILIAEAKRGLILLDLGTSNGTFVDGVRVSPLLPISLSPSTDVSFGASRRKYRFSLDTAADKARDERLYARMLDTSGAAKADTDTTVFVTGISYEACEADVERFFSPCGDIKNIKLLRDRSTGEFKGSALVTFTTSSGFLQALARDQDELRGRAVRVKKSEGAAGGKGSGVKPQMRSSVTDNKTREASYYGPTSSAAGDEINRRSRRPHNSSSSSSSRSRSRSMQRRHNKRRRSRSYSRERRRRYEDRRCRRSSSRSSSR